MDTLCCKSHLKTNLKKRKHFTPNKGSSFLMSLFLSSCFYFQTRTDVVLVKFYYDADIRRFLKTFRKPAGKRLWWKPFLAKFKLFKIDSGKGIFLSVFRSPLYGCFQTFNRNTFIWMITLFGANTPESSKIYQKLEAFSYYMPKILRSETFLFSLTAKFTYFLEYIPLKKESVKFRRFLLKVSLLRIS